MSTVRTDEHAPRVFVSCLECYNAGRLIGDWYEASEAGDLTPTQVHHRPIHANTHEELWCLDFENIPVRYEMSPMDAAKWGELYDDLDDDAEWPALCAWVRSGDYVAEGNTDLPCLSDFRDRYFGVWDTLRDYLIDYVDSTGMLADVPEEVARYFDYEAYERDLQGDFTTEPAGPGQVYIFQSY
ncbi:MAG: antirestriction protein ArdA [Gordonia sp. (in: high G+C Gram-positive bacteria)]|uniref:antirestriction protein ArdA n=1 Tax=Gordonia sp. (in: high G+C Gram-positive bacteria) TaxID=84139 RepID=UPI003C719A37